MQTQTNYTGVDISKMFFDAAVDQAGKYRYYRFSNDEAGFLAIVEVLPERSHVVMEAFRSVLPSAGLLSSQ